jgi:hypothetical protein
MSDHTITFVRLIAARFSPLGAVLEEHMQDNFGEILPHVFFGDLTRYVVSLASEGGTATEFARLCEMYEILDYLEEVYSSGDEELSELISVSFLENLPRPGEVGSQIRDIVGPNLTKQLRVIG